MIERQRQKSIPFRAGNEWQCSRGADGITEMIVVLVFQPPLEAWRGVLASIRPPEE